jgi:hypothetical protein
VRQQADEAGHAQPLALADEMNWSNSTCAPLAKSPNCASHIVSAFGSASE